MAANNPLSRGDDLAARLAGGVREAESAPMPGARDLPVLRGMNKGGDFTRPIENVLAEAADILARSGRVFRRGDQLVVSADRFDGGGEHLVPLRSGDRVEAGAEAELANIFVCEHFAGGEVRQYAPTRQLAELLLRSEPALARLPLIRLYAGVPVYDPDFILRGPGWHPGHGILVHGPAVEPTRPTPADPAAPALSRLPARLRELFGGFCFAGAADLANALAVFLTGLLVNLFVQSSKPVALLDGNQPGLGKTLLARVALFVLTGADPRLMRYTPDEAELEKLICATLRGGERGGLVIDNARVRGGGAIESAVLESNSTAPTVSLRVLGSSTLYTRPNDLLWFVTMNDTRASPDLISRGLPIRLAHEGDPKDRVFAGPDPLTYAREYRLELLGELTGMVEHWKRLGRPESAKRHRCDYWARVVGGVVEAAGFPEFLANLGEASAAFSTALDDLAALAEAAVGCGPPFVVVVETPFEGPKAGAA